MTRILQTDLARDALYTKVNQIADEKVSLEDDETITGKKTFTQNIVRANTNLTKGTNPSSTSYCSVELTDKNGSGTTHRAGVLEATVYTTGETMTSINAYKWQANANYSARIAIYYPTSGNPYTEAPTPTDTIAASSGTQIATTGWVNSNFMSISGTQNITGAKTFVGNQALFVETTNTAAGSWVDFIQKINGARRGTMRTMYNSDGSYQVLLGCNGPNAEAATGIIVKRNASTTTATAPTPTTTTDTSSTEIATTGWVNGTSHNLVHKSGNETIAGTKTFSTSPVVPTPAVSSNTTVPATTAYVNTKFKKVNSLPSSPDSNTFYFIPE